MLRRKSKKSPLKESLKLPFLWLQWGGRKLKSFRWWLRWPVYLIIVYLTIAGLSWSVDKALPPVKNPEFGVSFSIKYAEELGNNWQANYLALLNDLNFKRLRLMSYWDLGEPQKGQYDFTDLDWEIQQADIHNAQVSLALGYRQPRWPECHEPEWAKAEPIESTQWKKALNTYIATVVNRYKNDPAIVSYQLENEPENNWFGGCRGGIAPKSRLSDELNLVKKLDPKHPVYMSLSDEHGLPIGQPTPDAYGFSIYRVVYSTNTPIHFYITYPITDWYHRLRIYAIHFIKHRPVYVHELQLEPWGPKATKDLSISEQNRSMSVPQMTKSINYSEKTGIKLQYMWGAEWWYWRKTQFNDPGPWNVIKQTLQETQKSSQ